MFITSGRVSERNSFLVEKPQQSEKEKPQEVWENLHTSAHIHYLIAKSKSQLKNFMIANNAAFNLLK